MFHLHVGYRSRDGGGSCEAARQYIAREGRYAKRGDTVRWIQSLHMPLWAGGASAPRYWRAAEGPDSRVNARTVTLIEIAVPRQLPRADQDALVIAMGELLSSMGVEDSSSDLRMPLTLAFHEGHGRNPHVHCMLSLSLNDGLARDEKTWFRRFAPKNPERGGARKSEYVTKLRWLHRVREAWAGLANTALARCGLAPSLDHRSHAERQRKRTAQIHLGPRVAHMKGQGVQTVRGDRHAAIAAENDAALAFEVWLLRKKKELQKAELENAVELQAERDWAATRQQLWMEILQDHPLARDDALRSHACAIVLESDPSNLATVRQAFDRQSDTRAVSALVGPDWDVISTPAGFWAVRPGYDEVVLLAPGYVATDGEDEANLLAMMKASALLGLKRPRLFVQEHLMPVASRVLDKLGWDWPTNLLRRKASKRVIPS